MSSDTKSKLPWLSIWFVLGLLVLVFWTDTTPAKRANALLAKAAPALVELECLEATAGPATAPFRCPEAAVLGQAAPSSITIQLVEAPRWGWFIVFLWLFVFVSVLAMGFQGRMYGAALPETWHVERRRRAICVVLALASVIGCGAIGWDAQQRQSKAEIPTGIEPDALILRVSAAHITMANGKAFSVTGPTGSDIHGLSASSQTSYVITRPRWPWARAALPTLLLLVAIAFLLRGLLRRTHLYVRPVQERRE